MSDFGNSKAWFCRSGEAFHGNASAGQGNASLVSFPQQVALESVFLSQGKFQLYGVLFELMPEIISFDNLPHLYPKVSLFPLPVTWQDFGPTLIQ